jgi:hypothetical protein
VVAGYFQPPTQQPDGSQIQRAGHIFVVRPQEPFPPDRGPQVVTAGVQNFKSASVKFAFGNHPLAWPDSMIPLSIRDLSGPRSNSLRAYGRVQLVCRNPPHLGN